jgi:hypothetical protein
LEKSARALQNGGLVIAITRSSIKMMPHNVGIRLNTKRKWCSSERYYQADNYRNYCIRGRNNRYGAGTGKGLC